MSFLTKVYTIDNNEGVRESNDIDEAAEFFEHSFRSILDEYAPMKTIQIRKTFSLFISDNTKDIILNRKTVCPFLNLLSSDEYSDTVDDLRSPHRHLCLQYAYFFFKEWNAPYYRNSNVK